MPYCTTVDETTVTIPTDDVDWRRSLNDVLAILDEQLADATPETGQEAVDIAVLAMLSEVRDVTLEDALELRQTVAYPGDVDALPEHVETARLVEQLATEIASWRTNNTNTEPTSV